jgi:predicted metal-dependent hydrolase
MADERSRQLAVTAQPATAAYTLTRSARRRRTIEISIDASGGVCVAVPVRTPAHEIDAFVRKKQRWIAKAVDAMRSAGRHSERQFVTGEALPYLGETLRLRVVEDGAAGVRRVEGRLDVRVDARQNESERRAAVRQRVEGWYKSQAEVVLRERVRLFAPLAGAVPARVLVKTQKSRWGSCGKDGALRLNWALIMAPLPVIDYLVVHELCHLRQAGHGRRFWRLVAKVLPDYVSRRAELRREGGTYRL